ncbi:MAG TPA: WcaF family extracellular polysaccharide biosynthesis acetyltransferase [Segetibacter sp.]|jgi:putative colanic acid biosynthesis acetyltransferase WcaF
MKQQAEFKKDPALVNLANYNNSWYKPGPSWKIGLWMLTSFLFFSHPLALISSFKCFLLRCFGASIGKGVVIKPSVNIKYPWHLKIGDNTWVGEKVWIDNLAQVTISKNVCLSHGAMLLTGNHNYSSPVFALIVNEIILEDGVWLGAKSIVCPGVICKTHAVLSVASIATKDLEAFSVYYGNPAIKVKNRVFE